MARLISFEDAKFSECEARKMRHALCAFNSVTVEKSPTAIAFRSWQGEYPREI